MGAEAATLRRLLWLAGVLGALLGIGSLREWRMLDSSIDPDLATTPAVAALDVALLVVRVLLIGSLVVAALLVRVWLRGARTDLEVARAAGLVDPEARGWSVLVAPTWHAPDDPSPRTTRVPSDRRLARVAIGLSVIGGLGLALGTATWMLAGELAVARAAALAIVVAAGLWLVGVGLLVRLVHRVERREAVVAGLGRAGTVSVPAVGRWPVGLVVASLSFGILLLQAVQPVQPDPDRSCITSSFFCTWLIVERHHDSGDAHGPATTIEYALRPADGTRIGTMIVAVGGPGSAGVTMAESISQTYPERLLASYDIVVYDPRGVGGSDVVECPRAAIAYGVGEDDARAHLDMTARLATQFAVDCVAEVGLDAATLASYGSAQTVEDIDAIRADLGLDRFVLYGESYGSGVAQRYARAHGDRLDALILDGVLDLGQPTQAMWLEAANGFEAVLEQVMDACASDETCAHDLPDPAGALDRVLAQASLGSVSASFGDLDGIVRDHPITDTAIVEAVSQALYTDVGRSAMLRALAAAETGDRVPMGRLASPGGRLVSEVAESSFAYYATWCADYTSGTGVGNPEAFDVAGYVQAGADAGALDLRLGHAYLSVAPCLAWPSRDPAAVPSTRLTETPFPVFVLTSRADPVTPVAAARRVAAHLVDGYLIESHGGSHVTFGRGQSCPDDLVTDYLVDGRRPAIREVSCAGSVLAPYQPWLGAIPFAQVTADEAADLIDQEAYLHADYLGWDGVGQINLGCRFGGVIVVERSAAEVSLRYESCAVFDGVPMTGAGVYRDDDTTLLEPAFKDSELRIEYDADGALRVTGTLRGEPIVSD